MEAPGETVPEPHMLWFRIQQSRMTPPSLVSNTAVEATNSCPAWLVPIAQTIRKYDNQLAGHHRSNM